jgi:large subunit ribosomal protein L21
MYAVVRAGGKQHKVSKGDIIEIERLGGSDDEVSLEPVLVVTDDGAVHSLPSQLSGAKVTGRVMGETNGPKVRVVRYRSKTGYRRHTGHRQRFTAVQIADIEVGGQRSRGSSPNSPQQEDGNGS